MLESFKKDLLRFLKELNMHKDFFEYIGKYIGVSRSFNPSYYPGNEVLKQIHGEKSITFFISCIFERLKERIILYGEISGNEEVWSVISTGFQYAIKNDVILKILIPDYNVKKNNFIILRNVLSSLLTIIFIKEVITKHFQVNNDYFKIRKHTWYAMYMDSDLKEYYDLCEKYIIRAYGETFDEYGERQRTDGELQERFFEIL